jgi:Uma2 family endonuclease
MAVTSDLLTVAEFEALPQPRGGVRQELHHGEVFELPPVKLLHTIIQKQLVARLEDSFRNSPFGVDKEFPFRPLPEHEVWIADVAVYLLAVLRQMSRADYYHGVPVAVIEVLSPSNTASEMLDRERMCLQHGGEEFWLVDPKWQTIKVATATGYSTVYDVNGVVESHALGVSIPVREIFYS